jgi:hypothetical protein
MKTKVTKHLMTTLAMAAALSLLGSGAVRADVPGYDFMMFPEGMAMVVDGTGKASKAKITEDTAQMLTAGAQPLSDAGIVLLYQGKLYIVPDKALGDGKMMSTMVMSAGSGAKK